MYTTRFTVMGKVPFPLDMLRYDECFPRESGDASRIGWEAEDFRSQRLSGDGICRVTLIHRHPHRGWLPTEARWQSFLWSVDRDSIEEFKYG